MRFRVLRLGLFCLIGLAVSGLGASANAAKRPPAIQHDSVMAPVKLPNGETREAEVTVFTVIPDVEFIEAACAYRKTVERAVDRVLQHRPMTLEEWGKLERGSRDALLTDSIKHMVQKPWIMRVHAVAGPRARPKYTVWYDSVRVLRCSDWERWKNRIPPPPPPLFDEPIFRQMR